MIGGPWSVADLADAAAAGLAARAAALDLEQAVDGLDALDEVALHPVLAEGLREAGLGVEREVRYPSGRIRRRRSEGARCDLVLTPDPARPLALEPAHATLFDPAAPYDLEDAFWLEVKSVAQFGEGGVPNRAYAGRLGATVRADVTKLAGEPRIRHAGLLLLLFAADEAIAMHDLEQWAHACLTLGLPIGAPARRALPITERRGHGCAALALHPVHHL